MMRIISRAISLANSPSLTQPELAVRAKDWAETLVDFIPENRLSDAFRKAIADHNSTFPMSAYELKTAFEKISVDEHAIYLKAREKDLAELERLNLTANYHPCEHCFDAGWVIIKRPDETGRLHSGAIRCEHCDYWWRVRERLANGSDGKLAGYKTKGNYNAE